MATWRWRSHCGRSWCTAGRRTCRPGPGTPDDAGVCLDAVEAFAGRFPMLGVCLGHQCIGQAYGGRIVRAPELRHGKTSVIYHDGQAVYEGLDGPFEAVRYHSLVVE